LGVWKYIWGTKGGGDTLFHQKLYLIEDPLYYYKGFQFRFISQGEMEGSYDIWNLDYILLDTSRNIADLAHPDVTIQKAPISLLKKFTAMPFQQFFFDGNNTDLKDTLAVTFVSLRLPGTDQEEQFKLDSTRITNGNTHQVIDKIPYINNFSGNIEITPSETHDVLYRINPTTITKPGNQNNLKLVYSIGFPGLSNTLYRGVHYQTNDTITGYTWLKDYYAYDDSTAEWSAAINQSAGKMAVGFPLNQQDSLVAIDIYLPNIQQNYTGQPLDMIVWSHIFPESELGRVSVALNYTGNNNQFKRYTFDDYIIVKDTVYVGFQQNVDYEIPIGFDVNSSSFSKGLMWYSVNDRWAPLTDPGSLMIRPVFKSGGDVTGIFNPKGPSAELDCDVFPNPTTGLLNIQGDIKAAVLTDLSGKTIIEKNFTIHDIYKSIELQNLPAGFYLLRLSNDKASTVKKIILVK
jgi:hypothetical protein